MSKPKFWYYSTVEKLIAQSYCRGRASEQLNNVWYAIERTKADIENLPNGNRINELMTKLLLERSETIQSTALKYYVCESTVIKLKSDFIYRVADYLGYTEHGKIGA